MTSTQVKQEQFPLLSKVRLTLSLRCLITGLTRNETVTGRVIQSKIVPLSSAGNLDIEYKIDVDDSKNFGYNCYSETKLVMRRHNQLTKV